MTTFLLIRHGMTDAVNRLMTGQRPGLHLNAVGVEQAARLPSRLDGVPLDWIYASPLERTRETAAPLAAARGLEVRIEPRVIEIDYGQWTGLSYAEMVGPEWDLYNQFRGVTRPPGGESLLDIQARSVNAVLELSQRHPGEVVAVVSHGDTLRAVLLYFMGIPVDFVQRLELSPARISVLQLGDGAPRVLQVNGDGVPPLPPR